MKFTLPSTAAQLTHLNTRKEKHGEDTVVAVDLDLCVQVDADELLSQLCLGDHQPLVKALWVDDAHGSVRDPSISTLRLTHKLEGHTLRFSTDLDENYQSGTLIADATIKKFKLEAQNGRMINLRFQAQVHPTKNELAKYAEGLKQEHVRISIEQGPQLELAVDNKSKAAGG